MNPDRSVIRKKIAGVEFGFYTDEDVKNRSVLRVTSPESFDPSNNPIPEGLYDPRLGVDRSEGGPGECSVACVTCAMNADHCQGHFGHIELRVPLVHPLLFMEVLRFLGQKCVNCHNLRAAPRKIRKARAQFALLYAHKIDELKDFENKILIAVREGREQDSTMFAIETEDDGKKKKGSSQRAESVSSKIAMDDVLFKAQPDPKHYSKDSSSSNKSSNLRLNSYERALRKEMVTEFLLEIGKSGKVCPHCGAHNPKIRHVTHTKIFQSWTKTAVRNNAAEGIVIRSAQAEEKNSRNNDNKDAAIDSDGENSIDADAAAEAGEGEHFMPASEVRAQLQRTWKNEPFLCNCLFGPGASFDDTVYQMFFMQNLPVAPNKFRPIMHTGGGLVEHSQSQHLRKIMELDREIAASFAASNLAGAFRAWLEMQGKLNAYIDSSRSTERVAMGQQPIPGIRQILEKKEGLFRKNMMGKRVDYACRSVISPDVSVGTNEIGLPRHFASVLTFPTPVTERNIQDMRRLVERGSNYPGARYVEVHGRRLDLNKMKPRRREDIAKQLLNYLKNGVPVIVGRQMRDGDYVLMNRQPTLHKPGIMGHRVRVFQNPLMKTTRMHYANCNTYNADFDGDEMNCHYPQTLIGQAEARYIAQTDYQYIVPTNGSPLRGLIQDHVVAGVKMTKRDTFLERWQYQQLVFEAVAGLPNHELIPSKADIELLPPAILKPRQLWTGKQVISTVMLNLKKGCEYKEGCTLLGISMERKAKTPDFAFGAKQQEHLVLMRDGELLRGVLDKSAFGATDFGLVHAVYEAYGPETAGLLLTSFGRLFTAYLQYYEGHSCRMEDLVLTKDGDNTRRALVMRAYAVGARAAKAWADSDGGKIPIKNVAEQPGGDMPLLPSERADACDKIGELLSGLEGDKNFAALDSYMQGQLNPLASDIVSNCLPEGLAVQFPHNTFSIMTNTGAKGSIVNQSQVTCALGQQALEGRRVPRMSSGKTLPSFAAYDPNPRADGFVADRFLTGIRPQEYYFHCMAGREGLVDTAVKTSRSGYLQRCLIKHLEELKVSYDYTVRNAERGVVQFLYGEDALDPTKASYLDGSEGSFEYFARNFSSLKRQSSALPNSRIDIAATDAVKKNDMDEGKVEFPVVGDLVLARKLKRGQEWRRGLICQGWHEAKILKIHSGGRVDFVYTQSGQVAKKVPIEIDLKDGGKGLTRTVSTVAVLVKPMVSDPIISSLAGGHRLGTSGACVAERFALAALESLEKPRVQKALDACNVSDTAFAQLVGAKFSSSLCNPGEAVGCIAAQSVGEPSTQMTLNTFHLAGSGANLTLGIPRLREIIMTASKTPKTPLMSVPIRDQVSEDDAQLITRELTRLTLSTLISGDRGITVTQRFEEGDSSDWVRSYYIVLKFHPGERIREAFGLTLDGIASVLGGFSSLVSKYMARDMKEAGSEAEIGSAPIEAKKTKGKKSASNDVDEDGNLEPRTKSRDNDHDELNDEDDDDDDGDINDDDGADADKVRNRKMSVSYEEDNNEEDVNEDENEEMSEDENDDDSKDNNDLSNDNEEEDIVTLDKNATHPVVHEHSDTIVFPPMKVDPTAPPLLMVEIAETAAAKTYVRSKKGIQEAFITNENGRRLETLGVNMVEFWELDESLVDHDGLESNDIWAMCCTYGVEAARITIVNQIKAVFGVYGIIIDPRHLSLLADYMTYEGGYKAMNRTCMDSSSSPFLRMSFEQTCVFMQKAAIAHDFDDLQSPSANIVMGRPILHGTGAFDLLTRAS